MKTKLLRILALVGKIVGFVGALNVIPFVPQEWGIVIFAGASVLKDTVNRVGDLLDDGVENKSFRA